MIMQEKIKIMKKNKFRIRRIRFYSAKVTSLQKSPQITHRTHGDSSQSPYPYHTVPIPMGIPMGIPMPTAALPRSNRSFRHHTSRQTRLHPCPNSSVSPSIAF